MAFEHLAPFLATFGTWLTAGLLSGWLFGLLSPSSRGRR
jgi:hypothetical protein